ncbi:MAG: M1 family peptidase, partial [Zetaproteobacteria bacterium]
MTSARLPRTVVPSRYEIRIEPDLAAATFVGQETIELTVREPTAEIVLNAADLGIRSAVFLNGAGRRAIAKVAVDVPAEQALLRCAEPLDPGPWRLSLEFDGVLNDRLRGFYRSTFTRDDGTKAALAVTQFEATDARRAFPCWDEPAFKAVFQVTLVVDAGLAAISNTSPASVRGVAASGKKAVTF